MLREKDIGIIQPSFDGHPDWCRTDRTAGGACLYSQKSVLDGDAEEGSCLGRYCGHCKDGGFGGRHRQLHLVGKILDEGINLFFIYGGIHCVWRGILLCGGQAIDEGVENLYLGDIDAPLVLLGSHTGNVLQL